MTTHETTARTAHAALVAYDGGDWYNDVDHGAAYWGGSHGYDRMAWGAEADGAVWTVVFHDDGGWAVELLAAGDAHLQGDKIVWAD